MLSEEQKYEHTHERIMLELDMTHDNIKDMIEQSGLDIDTSDLNYYFEALKSNVEIMMESS
tara:strand:- start:166 stop:348 length:183 start_codon:yes stop_codon:yes gene_type:complete